MIREITETTNTKIDIDEEGLIKVFATSGEEGERAIEWIKGIVAEAEVGTIYTGKVVRIVDFGAYVNFLGDKDGHVHVSEIADHRVKKVTDELSEGQEVNVKVVDIDPRGKVRLSMKVINQETGEDMSDQYEYNGKSMRRKKTADEA